MGIIKHYVGEISFKSPSSRFETEVEFVDEDTLTTASQYKNACCLNFASHRQPGGGYKSVWDIKGPIKTQEEDLFRRSNLPELMDTPEVRSYYPLDEMDGLFTGGIIASKNKVLDPCDPFEFSMVTVPAVINPQPHHAELVESKIRRIFEIAADHNAEVLILGAWGCGIFNNDPRTIAELFKKNIEGEFAGVFRKVIFAIPGKHTANHQIFEQVLEK